MRTPTGRISKASVDPFERSRATGRFAQGAIRRGLNKTRTARGGKVRGKHGARADDMDLTLEEYQQVDDDAFEEAQITRSNGGVHHAPMPHTPQCSSFST